MVMSESEVAEVKVTYSSKVKPSERVKVTNSREVYAQFLPFFEANGLEHVESFMVMGLNRNNKVLGIQLISKGGLAGTVADPKVIFQFALLTNSSSIIVAHNHPSGNIQPSQADIQITKKLQDAGKFLELPLTDHLILTPEKYYSFADEGLI